MIVGDSSAVQGHVVMLGMWVRSVSGGDMQQQPWRRPKRSVSSAMVMPHQVVRWSFRNKVIPT